MAALAAVLVVTWNSRRREKAVSLQEVVIYILGALILIAGVITAFQAGDRANFFNFAAAVVLLLPQFIKFFNERKK